MADYSAIYKITHRDSGKVYVGSALNVGRRKIEHWRDLRGKRHGNRKLQNAWNKYGEAAFVFTVLEKVDDPADLITREQVWIDSLQATGKQGYNLAPKAGSILGFVMSAETRERMSLAAVGKTKTREHVEKVRQALLGRKMTDEQREKMRKAKLGKKRGPHSEATKAKMSAWHMGRVFSEEHKANLAAAKRGTKRSPEANAKHRATLAAKRLALSPPP